MISLKSWVALIKHSSGINSNLSSGINVHDTSNRNFRSICSRCVAIDLIFGKATETMKKKQLVEDEYTSQDMTTNNNRNNATQPHEGYQTFGNIDNTITDEEEGPLILGSIEFKPKLQS